MKELNITCFLAAARARNISLAAQELRLSQQAVSRNIRSLEESLGFTLLYRRNDGIRLTDAGQCFLEVFLEQDKELRGLWMAFSRTPTERLRVGWSEWSGCPDHLIQALRTCVQAQSEDWIDIQILSDRELCSLLEDGGLDLAFLTGYALGPLSDALTLVLAAKLDMFLVSCPEAVPDFRPGETTHLAGFCRECSETEVVRRVHREYHRLGLRPGPVMVLPNQPSLHAQLLCGGVSFVPRNLLNSNEKRFRLQPLDWQIPLYAAAPPDAGYTADRFLKLLAEGRLGRD